jgi:hypothetical protein
MVETVDALRINAGGYPRTCHRSPLAMSHAGETCARTWPDTTGMALIAKVLLHEAERWASGAANSGSEVRADAVGGRLHALDTS